MDGYGKAVPLPRKPAWQTSAKQAATKAAQKSVPMRPGKLRGPLPASEVERLLRLGDPDDSDAYNSESDDSVERFRSLERSVKRLQRSDDSDAIPDRIGDVKESDCALEDTDVYYDSDAVD